MPAAGGSGNKKGLEDRLIDVGQRLTDGRAQILQENQTNADIVISHSVV
jgi:hypothetical protein